MVDKELFNKAKDIMCARSQGSNGIGTMAEKSVHATLKYYFAPDEKYHEVKIASFVADICMDGEITEIQTRQFYTMKKKLDLYLQNDYDVTIVYPVCEENTIVWIDTETGELKRSRKVKKKKLYNQILVEMYGIRDFISDDRIHFAIVKLETEDYRYLDGFGKDKKVRATKTDKYPVDIIDEIRIDSKEDYKLFLPNELPERFDARSFGKLIGLTGSDCSMALLVLETVGVLEKCGKEGRKNIYKRI